jgi:hypothetical protein
MKAEDVLEILNAIEKFTGAMSTAPDKIPKNENDLIHSLTLIMLLISKFAIDLAAAKRTS